METIEKTIIEMVGKELPSQWLPELRHLIEQDRKNTILAVARFCQERIVKALKNGQQDHAANVWLAQIKEYFPQYQSLIDNPVSTKTFKSENFTQNHPSKNNARPLNPREKDSLLKIIALMAPILAEKISKHHYIKTDGRLNISEFALWIAKNWIKKHPRTPENMSSSNIEKKLKEALKLTQ